MENLNYLLVLLIGILQDLLRNWKLNSKFWGYFSELYVVIFFQTELLYNTLWNMQSIIIYLFWFGLFPRNIYRKINLYTVKKDLS